MKRLINYSIILSLSLVVFGCDSVSDSVRETFSEVSSGPTIDKDSDEYDYIETSRKGITTYKGEPFNGSVTETYENGQLEEKTTYKDGKKNGSYEEYYENGQLRVKETDIEGRPQGVEYYDENGQLKKKKNYNDGIPLGVEYYDENGQLIRNEPHNVE